MDREPQPLLRLEGLETGYGNKQVLHGASLDLGPGEVLALLGHNGAGKTTALKAVYGLLPVWAGSIWFEGHQLNGRRPADLLEMGIAYVPQGNRVFDSLTVRENLSIGGRLLRRKRALEEAIERAAALFPELEPLMGQSGGALSGGQKQLVALAGGLMTSPRLLLLDEPSLGLASALSRRVLGNVAELCRQSQIAALVVEQKVREVLQISERVCVLRNGRVSFLGAAEKLQDEATLREVFL